MLMSEQDKFKNNEIETPEAKVEEPAAASSSAEPRRYLWLAIVSILLTAVAWLCGLHSGVAAMIVSAIAIVAGVMSLRSRRHAIRNTAITAIIASAVLLVVICAFIIVIYMGLRTI